MRKKNDLYTTQDITPRITQVLLKTIHISGNILEPCSGPFLMSNTLKDSSFIESVTTNDIDSQFETDYNCNATYKISPLWLKQYDWVITNPPYTDAFEIIKNAWDNARIGIAFFLLQTWDEPNFKRGEWLEEMSDHQTHKIIIHPRPNFRKGEINPETGKRYGGYSCTFCWYIWQKKWSWKEKGIQSPFQYIRNWNI